MMPHKTLASWRLAVGGRRMRTLALAAVVSLSTGCAMWIAPVIPPQGLIYTKVSAPITTHFDNTPAGAAAPKVASKSTYYIWVPLNRYLSFAWGDQAVQKLAEDHGMTRIAFADYERITILGVFGKFTVTVYGS